MKPENEQYLKDHLDQFIIWERAFYFRNLGAANRENFQRIIQEEINSAYSADLWCGPCVGEMVTTIYRHYHSYLKAKHNDNTVYKDLSEGILQMKDREVEPVKILEPEPLKVAANFPLNKLKRRYHKRKLKIK